MSVGSKYNTTKSKQKNENYDAANNNPISTNCTWNILFHAAQKTTATMISIATKCKSNQTPKKQNGYWKYK